MVIESPLSERLVLAVQKSGRLSEDSIDLVSECGIEFSKGKVRLRSSSRNFPVEILFLRDDDLPGCVARGEADVAIVGENVVAESDATVVVLERLGFGKCRLSVAVPREATISSIKELSGRAIATSYPKMLEEYLVAAGVDASIKALAGSVELAPSINMADAIFDIVSSGSTLIANGLRELAVVRESEAVLISTPRLSPRKEEILGQLLFRVRSVLRGRQSKYILLNAPNDAIETIARILPGLKSPTVMPLSEPGWSSLHAVVSEDGFWQVVEDLKRAGAQGILVTSIEKVVA